MHLSRRAYALLLIAAGLAIAAIWSSERGLESAWQLLAGLLLAGLTAEGVAAARTHITIRPEGAVRAWLGRREPAALLFRNGDRHAHTLAYAPVVPAGCAPPAGLRKVTVPARGTVRECFDLLPGRLGAQPWPPMPARLLGLLKLGWWSLELAPEATLQVVPDTLRIPRLRPVGAAAGLRARMRSGAGAELLQLRGYLAGDPPARIDWKASARARNLVTRELSEDQHLDVLVAIDASRHARAQWGGIERLGAYANIAARLAQICTANDDRIGLVVYADRVLAACAPQRGLSAVRQVRRCLERTRACATEPDPMAAALYIRALQRHRSCIILLTELEDAGAGESLGPAVRLLTPPHLVVLAAVRDPALEALAYAPPRERADPWIALAAQAQLRAAREQRARLARLGAPVVHERPGLLEAAVFARYARLRSARRI